MTQIENGGIKPNYADFTVPQKRENDAHFMGDQIFLIDPRKQGFGLKSYGFLDAYANKFFILAGSGGVFISPKSIPSELLTYYAGLGIDIPSSDRIITLTKNEESLVQDPLESPTVQKLISKKQGSFVIPYMITPEVEQSAYQNGLRVFTDAKRVDYMADKARFQEELTGIADDLKKETGYNIAIPFSTHKAGDLDSVMTSHQLLSGNDSKSVVVAKPKSASGLGIFIVQAGQGIDALKSILVAHFQEEEEVLLEQFVDHNHAPSMQGVRYPDTQYKHLYFGRQLISFAGKTITYDASQIPFGDKTVTVNSNVLDVMHRIHEVVGKRLVQQKGIAGVIGFDGLMDMSDGQMKQLKLTELNLHLPSSIAVYVAITKLFPDGFEGIAHNVNISLKSGQSVDDFMRTHTSIFVKKKNSYGVFPLNLSYDDKVDIIIFAKDSEHLASLLGEIQQ